MNLNKQHPATFYNLPAIKVNVFVALLTNAIFFLRHVRINEAAATAAPPPTATTIKRG